MESLSRLMMTCKRSGVVAAALALQSFVSNAQEVSVNKSTGLYEYATVKESAEAGISARFATRLQALGYENISNVGDTLLQANGYTSHVAMGLYPVAIRYSLRVTIRPNRYRLVLTGFDLLADGSSSRLESMGNRYVRMVNKKLPDILNPLLKIPAKADKW